MKKRVVSVILAAALVSSALAGCGNSGTGGQAAATNEGESAAQTEAEEGSGEEAAVSGDNSYTMFMRNTYVDWIEELKWYDAAEEATGIHVEYVEGPDDFNDVYAEVDQRIISNTLPDAVMTKLAQTNVYGPQGAFVDLAPYIEKYAPNLQKYIDDNPDYKALVTDENGAIYGLVKESPIFGDFLGYRVDHLEKAGVDAESIRTVDDFTEAMRTLKAYYGADNPNYYPLTGREWAVRFGAWFDCLSTVSATESHGIYYAPHFKDFSFDIMNDNCYTMVETMKTWFDEGLIQPQFAAGTFTEGDWEADMINGNGTFFYDYYNRAEWFMTNGGPDADPDYQMDVLGNFVDADGKLLQAAGTCKYNEECVTAINANCSEEKIRTILTFIDYFYSEEGITLANYGVEGESFEVAEDGSKEFIVDYATEESTPAGEKRWSFLSDRFTVCKPVDNDAFFQWNGELIANACAKYMDEEHVRTGMNLKYTSEESEELASLVATVFDAEIAGIVSFVTGNKELTPDTWKAFQDEMNALGLSRIEELQAEAYRNTYGE
ncbi:MAG TPA: hypothetical protein H9763_12245 [Candidatus Eisenbergiella merdigallinarum]|uniref:Extracellular solute-binding protein n=1 Tax=Candidatus Eisenbergiella merdigallinarum TaxID=2838552 RepID=A0A9D2MUA6_9FIRM|nr:hypothetical protein [Candidatus Eisenbergiella merdigallinarum]